MNDKTPESNPYLPIAVGFYLLALPLIIAIFLADTKAGVWANGAGAGVMIFFGVILHRSRS